MVFTFPYALVFWTVFVWAFTPEFRIMRTARRSVARADSPDQGSLRVIMLGMWLAFTTACPLAFVQAMRFPDRAVMATFWGGVLLLAAGSILRRHCWRMLGDSFTGDVRARPDQPIVTAGAYAVLRHPSYTAGMMMWTGIGLALGSWGSAALLIAVSFGAYVYRMAVEERALLAAVGEPYREFMRTRKRLVPFIY